MPETYDGNEGDDALAAGYPVMDGHEDRRDGWRAINLTRDLVARLATVVSAISLTWADITGKPSTFPPAGHTHRIADIKTADGAPYGDALQGVLDGKLDKTGGTISGNLFLPNSSAATSGYTNAFINVDGRVSRGASSERYKQNVTPAPKLGDLFVVGLDEFEMIDGDGARILGYIAEKLAANHTTARFVIYNSDGLADSIDWFQLLMAQNAQLHERLTELEGDRE